MCIQHVCDHVAMQIWTYLWPLVLKTWTTNNIESQWLIFSQLAYMLLRRPVTVCVIAKIMYPVNLIIQHRGYYFKPRESLYYLDKSAQSLKSNLLICCIFSSSNNPVLPDISFKFQLIKKLTEGMLNLVFKVRMTI